MHITASLACFLGVEVDFVGIEHHVGCLNLTWPRNFRIGPSTSWVTADFGKVGRWGILSQDAGSVATRLAVRSNCGNASDGKSADCEKKSEATAKIVTKPADYGTY
jgi:hypothetical protein